ncbi:MAG: tRNA (adenosine(37)-N6)-dimethylallyltransferase MiaA [Clostridia bacterium]|nr:tRNA (adenosine(37)-N6)-dimethylallyltransferase MiaA [Clostridia bacterium]
MTKIPIIVVLGPTASGKTALAIDIALSFDGEIVSADSMQIYKHMDIGTAKPTHEERAKAPHHLIDFVSPTDSYSVADYCADAHGVIKDITERGKLPVMCGGTGLYINSVINDVTFTEMKADMKLRAELFEIAKEQGGEKLIEMLAEFDPTSAKTLHPNNIKRIIRAIEFYKLCGVPISEHNEETKNIESRYLPLMFMIDYDREVLYERINKRVDIMIDMGLIDEVKSLMDMGCNKQMQSMQGIGYKEIIEYLDSKCSLEEAISKIKQASRNYAKRQLTWFRRDDRIIHLNPYEDFKNTAVENIKRFLTI